MALGAHESKKKLTLNTSDLDELDWSSTCKTFSHDFEDKSDTLNTSKLDVLDLSCNDAEGFNDFIRGSTSTPKRIQDNSPATSKLEFLDDVDNDDDVASSHQAPKQSFGHATTQYSNQNTDNCISNDSSEEGKFQTDHVLKEYKCCERNCIQKVHGADKIDARRAFSSLHAIEKRQWILDTLRTFVSGRLDSSTFYIVGVPVCLEAWRKIYGVSRTKLYEVYQMFRNNYKVLSPKHRQKRIKSKLKTNIAIGWMEVYFKRIGEKMPNTISINLPCYLTQEKIYQEMKRDLESTGDPCCSFSWFNHIWNEKFSNVHIPAEDRMSKCAICTNLEEEREKTTDKDVKSYLDRLFKEHNDLQMKQREKYYKHRAKAKRDPRRYMSLIIDGMDHSKLLIPRFLRKSKNTAHLEQLRCHLTGILDHGQIPIEVVDFMQWPHDSNFTINTLLTALERRQHLPDTLYLQMDNCWRENKNQFVLTFLALLVQLGIVKKVKVSFLMVGHTHEDIDQVFSRIKTFLVKNNLLALAELLDLFRRSYTPHPQVVLMRGIFDIKGWMDPIREPLHNIIYPHCFKLFKAEDGSVQMQYRNWCDDDWLPVTADGKPDSIMVLKANAFPSGEPGLVEPTAELQNLQKLHDDMPRYYESSTLFKENHKEEWTAFLAPEAGHFRLQNIDWPLPAIIQKKESQRKRDENNKQGETRSQLFPDLLQPAGIDNTLEKRVMADQGPIPKVYTGRYQKDVENQVREVEDHLVNLRVGCMVAVLLENYSKDKPWIGKVLSVTDDEFQIHYWKGSYNKPWSPDMVKIKDGKFFKEVPYTDILPKMCILLCAFELTEESKLTKWQKKYLQEKLKGESSKRKSAVEQEPHISKRSKS